MFTLQRSYIPNDKQFHKTPFQFKGFRLNESKIVPERQISSVETQPENIHNDVDGGMVEKENKTQIYWTLKLDRLELIIVNL